MEMYCIMSYRLSVNSNGTINNLVSHESETWFDKWDEAAVFAEKLLNELGGDPYRVSAYAEIVSHERAEELYFS